MSLFQTLLEEFHAAQKLLEIPEGTDKIFTADVGFCHRAITKKHSKSKRKLYFSAQRNQIKLCEKFAAEFSEIPAIETFTEAAKGHGREEPSVCQVLSTKGVID